MLTTKDRMQIKLVEILINLGYLSHQLNRSFVVSMDVI